MKDAPQLGPIWTMPGHLGTFALWIGLLAAISTMCAYGISLMKPGYKKPILLGRSLYTLTALCTLTTFGLLMAIVYGYHFEYQYAAEHTGTGMSTWYRLAATWSGQEGSFLLWAFWTSLLGFLVFRKAGKYEARIMPFYVSVIAFLCAILLKQSPFIMLPRPSHAELLAHPDWFYPPREGQGLNPSLQNYWMTIHPPTIFFGFSSLLAPFCYAVAALIWRDYKGWTTRVMPYALLSCGTLGIGLIMGGYWAYETLGWHGFWAWDPVENASFFPWLAVTALVHGLVVQKSRGGMGRTNTFLGILCFWLFLLGTFLTRSGILSDVSIHSFQNIGKSGLVLMVTMMIVYGVGGFGLWLARVADIPGRKTTGDTLLSRDFAFFLAVTLLVLACVFVTLGTTAPLGQKLLHKTLSAPQAVFYNRSILPLAVLAGLLLGCVPWLAWRKTNPDTFLRKLMVPWLGMILFGVFLLIWVISAERASLAARDLTDEAVQQTLRAWVSPSLQRISVILLASVGFLAMLSNAALAYRVFRSKPLAMGGWLAHVGIGVLMIGVIISNTYERTQRVVLIGNSPAKAFDYQFEFEKMTGKPILSRPLNPNYDRQNSIQIRVTPPSGEGEQNDGSHTYLVSPRWFAYNLATAQYEAQAKDIIWPEIHKYMGHDLYVALADKPRFVFVDPDDPNQQQHITLLPKQHIQFGPYVVGYFDSFGQPGKFMGVHLVINPPDGKPIVVSPIVDMTQLDEQGNPVIMPSDYAVPELTDANGVAGVAQLTMLNPGDHAATINLSLPGANTTGVWVVPLEVTYKPWVNLVWIGVLIAVAGIFLAMVHRALEARHISDGPLSATYGSEKRTVADADQARDEDTFAEEATSAPLRPQPGKSTSSHRSRPKRRT